MTTGTSAELSVHASALMPLGTDDSQTAGFLHFGCQLDIRTTTGHVGCDGHDAGTSGFGNDLCLLLVQLSVEHVVLDFAEREHSAQELGNLDTGCTDEDRSALLYHGDDLIDDGIVFLALGAIDTVVHVDSRDRFVGRNNDYVEFVYIPELTRFGFGGTGHTGELVVHTEIVLQGDGCESLGGTFHLHVLLRLHRLVQTIRPAAALHNTAGLLIDNLHFSAVDDIIDIFLEEGVGFEQLVHGVYALGLHRIVGEDIVLLRLFLIGRKAFRVLEFRHLRTHIRKDEEIRVIGGARQRIDTFVGQLDGLVLLVNDEIEFVRSDMHILLILLEIELLRFLQTHLDARLGEVFDERLGFRHTLEGAEERQFAGFFLFLVSGTHFGFSLSEQFGGKGCLLTHKCSDAVLVFIEHLVLATGHRTGDDKRRTGIVYKHRVHLIDDGEVMSALNEVERANRHVITQIIEAELVVRTESDITGISLAAVVRVGFVLVDTIDTQAMEHIERSHPFGVTAREVIVHGHDMHTLVSEGVEEDGQGSDERLTFTGSHLGDGAALLLVVFDCSMEHDATEELHVIVHHIPCDFVTPRQPMVVVESFVAINLDKVESRVGSQILIKLGGGHLDGLVLRETASGRFDNRKRFGQDIGQGDFVLLTDFLLKLVHLVVDFLTLLDRCSFDGCFEFGNAVLSVRHVGLDAVHERLGVRTEFIIRQRIDSLVGCLGLVHVRLNSAHIFLRLIAE